MSAVISDCGKYRYRLEREVGMDGPTYAYFGVNPSTADASIDDATVRKWIGFTKVLGGRRFIVGNVFGFRATDVRKLATARDPVGPENNAHHYEILRDADILVPCWGAINKVPKNLQGEFFTLLLRLLQSGKPVMHFGKTLAGDPKHPLMLGYSTKLQPFDEYLSPRGES